MLTIVRDPTGQQSRETHGLDFALSLTDNVRCHLGGGGDWDVWLNGEQVQDKAGQLARLATIADRLTLIYRPAGVDPITLYYIATAVLAVALYVAMPKPPGVDGLGGQESPNQRLTGQTNLARVYEALPDVYGKYRVWPDLIQQSSYEYIDNLRVVTEWLNISRGIGTVEAVRYADTAVDTMAGATWTAYYPSAGPDGLYEHGATDLPSITETYDSPEVNGQELPYAQAWPEQTATATLEANHPDYTFTIVVAVSPIWDKLLSIAGTGSAVVDFFHHGGADHFFQTCTFDSYTTASGEYTLHFTSPVQWVGNHSESVNASIRPIGVDYTWVGPYALPAAGDGIVLQIQFPRGLNASLQFTAEYWEIDEAGAQIGATLTSVFVLSGGSVDVQYRTHKISVAEGRYKFRIKRDAVQIGANDLAKMEEASASKFYPVKTVPGCTIIKVVTTATKQATSGSERRFNCEFTRHIVGIGSLDHAPSRNFGRAITHMWLVAGREADGVDADSLMAINAKHGEDSPLLRFDYLFSNRDVALGSRMQMAANAARCRVYREGRQWVTVRDEAQAYPLIQLDYRNLSAAGETSISESGHMPASEDGVEVEYTDEDGKTRAYVRLLITGSGGIVSGSGTSPRKVVLTGCRTQAQATDRAHLEARKILYQRRRVTETALMDVTTTPIGSLVRWVDPDDFLGDDGLQAGEVLAANGLTLTTSEPLHWLGESSGRISVTAIDGKPSAPVLCYPLTDSDYGCTVATLPDGLYVHTGARQAGSRYAFAPGITGAELEAAGLYVIESKKPDGGGNVQVELVNYDPRIYEMD